MKKVIFESIIVLTCLMLLLGCSGKYNKVFKIAVSKPGVDSLINGKWILKRINGIEVVKEKAGKEVPYLKFQLNESDLSGNTGCNILSGNFSLIGDEIVFSNMSMTKMFCSDAGYEYDLVNIVFHKGKLTYLTDGTNLSIYKNRTEILDLEREE